MPAPELSPLGERLRERTEPLAPDDDEFGWAHAHLCEALAQALLQLGQLYDPEADDMDPGVPLVDVDTCPDFALPWLAQLVGVPIPAGTSPERTRELIRALGGWQRGTPVAIAAVIGVYLTGNKTVYFRERDGGDPYRLEVVTLESETTDLAGVQAALLAQKPGGLVLSHRVVTGWDYQAMTTEGGLYSALPARFDDYYALMNNDRS